MKPKTVFAILGLVATINNFIEGYPRTLRNKPIVNLKPEKRYATEKPIELRKNTLFPRNTKKYVVTERPHLRATSPSSFKYVLVKRPLMLQFDQSAFTPLSRYDTSTNQPFINNVKFVSSTPSQSELANKINNWKNGRPIHIKSNQTMDENIDSKTLPEILKLNENKDIVSPGSIVKEGKNEKLEVAPENKTDEIIILPVNQEELKSNPTEFADEVNNIIAFVNRIHKPKENMRIEQQSKNMTKTSTMAPIDEVTKSSSTKDIEYIKVNNNESYPQKQMLPEESKINVYLHPEVDLIKPNSSYIENNKMTANFSPQEKSKKSETAESPKQEIVFLPVKLSDLKSNPNLVADEVQLIIDSINENASPVTKNNTATAVVTTSNSSTAPQIAYTPVPATSSSTQTAVKTIQIENKNSEKPENNIMSSEGEPSIDKSQDPHNDIEDVIYHVSKYDMSPSKEVVTTEKTVKPTAEDETLSNSPIEIVFIPALLTADEVKNNTKDKNELSIEKSSKKPTTDVSSSSISTVTDSTPTTMMASSQIPIEKVSSVSETNVSHQNQPKNIKAEPEVVFIPVNLNDFKSNPVIEDEVRDIVEYLNKIHPHNATTEALDIKNITRGSDLPVKEVTENSFSTSNQKTSTEATLSSVKPLADGVKHSNTNKDQITLRPSQEIVFIPINLENFKSNPDLVVDEVKHIISRMNDFNNSTTELSKDSASNTTCTGSYCSENITLNTEKSENVAAKHLFIKLIEVTALKDDENDDLYVGKPFHKETDNNKTIEGGHSKHAIRDDISDVIYVIKKNNTST